jgi:urea transporter
MRSGEIVLGVVPALISLLLIAATVRKGFKERTLPQLLLSLVVVVLCALALTVVYRISFRGAWPTFVPHLSIAIGGALYGAQIVLGRPGRR